MLNYFKISILSIVFLLPFYSNSQNAISNNIEDSTKTIEKNLYYNIWNLCQSYHYSPVVFTEKLSSEIWKLFLDKLDPNKNIFLSVDIDSLKKYQFDLKNEFTQEDPLQFYYACQKIYNTRIKQLSNLIFFKNNNSWKPLHFKRSDSIIVNKSWPNTLEERETIWNQNFTYQVYSKYIDQVNSKKDYTLSKATNSVYKKYELWLEKNTTRMKEIDFFSIYLNSICNIMDPHTEYQPPIQKQHFDQMLSNAIYGIGIQLGFDNNQNIIAKSLIGGMPAQKSGKIEPGDEILAIKENLSSDWTEIDGLDIQDVAEKIKGQEHVKLQLRIKSIKNNKLEEITLEREKVTIQQAAARSALIRRVDGKKIGVIYLPEFYNEFGNNDGVKSSKDFLRELNYLKALNVDAILVDLRNNGGGSLYEAINIAGFFIKKGPIVQLRDQNKKVFILGDQDSTMYYSGPLGVLINSQSASASEIFSAAMQDYNRAIIIGTNSFGKGTVQRQMPFNDTQLGAVKLTIEKFYRINGHSTQILGVTPDVFLPDRFNYYPIREKNLLYALPNDTINRLQFSAFKSPNNYSNNEIFNWKSDKNLVLEDQFDHWLASPKTKWLNEVKIKEQFTNDYNYTKKIESLDTLQTPIIIEGVGEYKTENWYQDWIKQLSKSVFLDEASKIVFKE